MFEKYQKTVKYLESFSNLPFPYSWDKTPEVYLKRTNWFLNLIGRPDKDLKFIHIGGTAGKGSVGTMVQDALYKSGKKVGLFTSPFATTTIEKIKVNDKYIDPNELSKIIENLKPSIDQGYLKSPYGGPSYFDILFCASLIYFKKQKCDSVVLEVAMGGEFDSTNTVNNKKVCAITNIDFDHTHILGKTLKKIATTKAGIIKPGCKFHTTETRPHLLKIFSDICKKKKVKMKVVDGKDYKEKNINLAKAIVENFGVRKVNPVNLPCRFEAMQKNPLVILDGAHSAIKMKSVVENLKKIKYKNLYLVIGTAKDKDSEGILNVITPLSKEVFVTRFLITQRKAEEILELKKLIKNKKVSAYLDPYQALEVALRKANKNDLILVAGSFFLAGELRKKWVSEKKILKCRKSF